MVEFREKIVYNFLKKKGFYNFLKRKGFYNFLKKERLTSRWNIISDEMWARNSQVKKNQHL